MTEEIIIIEANSKTEFVEKVNFNLKRGYKISSTSCGFVDSAEYDYCSIYQAILVKEKIIDGVDVAGCPRLWNGQCTGKDNKLLGNCIDLDCELKQLKRLEQENKALYEEKNCLHKIIDRLLENAGYSKDIASAEDFEDVYEDMQRKINELAELEQENKELRQQLLEDKILDEHIESLSREDNYRSALEEIRKAKKRYDLTVDNGASVDTLYTIEKIINEVLNDN